MASNIQLHHGVWAASLTPLDADLCCDDEALASHCFELIERGCQGVVLFGTTGEGPSFSVEERVKALEALISKGFPPERIILGNGSSGISDTAHLARAALKQGCASVLLSPPSFFKNIQEEGVIAFYREIIKKVANPELRILLYHMPQCTGVPITLPIIEALHRAFPTIVVGMKESEGAPSFAKKVIDAFPEMKVFVGKEKYIITAVQQGAAGSICGIANLYPELICSLYEKGRDPHSSNSQESEAVFASLQGYPFIPAAKAWMEQRKGASWRAIRPPLIPLDETQKRAFYKRVSSLTDFITY